jgi:hypothetical protein
MYPELPVCRPQDGSESTIDHGLRVLAFILREHVTGSLTDVDLEHADYAAGVAVTAREILPLAVDRISDVRHQIAAVLKSRHQDREVPVPGGSRGGCDTRPNEGPMAKLKDEPDTRPPEGEHADARPTLRDRVQF